MLCAKKIFSDSVNQHSVEHFKLVSLASSISTNRYYNCNPNTLAALPPMTLSLSSKNIRG